MPENPYHLSDGTIDPSLLSKHIPDTYPNEHQRHEDPINPSCDLTGESSLPGSGSRNAVGTDQPFEKTKSTASQILVRFSKMTLRDTTHSSKSNRLPTSRFAIITEEERENLCVGKSWAELIDVKTVKYELLCESNGGVSYARLEALNEGDILSYTAKFPQTLQKRPANTFGLNEIENVSALPHDHKYQKDSKVKSLTVCSSSLSAEEKLNNLLLTRKYGSDHPNIKGIKENQSHGRIATEFKKVKSGSYYCTRCGDYIRAGSRISWQKSRDNRKNTSNEIDSQEDRVVSKKRKT